jgi:uncharacterized protein YecE (DUF72 family)
VDPRFRGGGGWCAARAAPLRVIRIGISGWRYAGWRGVFYPKELQQRRELEFASRLFPSIEINGTFYSLQRAAYFQQWRDETPADFVFAVKGPRFLSHMKKLREPEQALANFFASGLLELGPKLGPILWQFPANFGFNPERITAFFKVAPRSQRDAAALAKRHDHRVKDPCVTATGDRPIRHAMEVRHKSFETREYLDLLAELGVANVAADAPDWPYIEAKTTDFAYIRLHGAEERYASGYDAPAIARWARLVRKWAKGGDDVFVYFDNDAKVRAPFDALDLMKKLKLRK